MSQPTSGGRGRQIKIEWLPFSGTPLRQEREGYIFIVLQICNLHVAFL